MIRRAGPPALLLAGVLASPALLAAPALAQSGRMASIEVQSRGDLTVSWHGDPARGCVEAGVCDLTGTTVFSADADADGLGGGPVSRRGRVDVGFRTGTARVVRGPAADPFGVCADRTGGFGIVLTPGRPAGGRVTYRPQGASSSVKGRCPGPLASDVVAALPAPSISTTEFGRDRRRLVLRGTRPFVSGPYSGTVTANTVSHVRYEDQERDASDLPDPAEGRRSRRLAFLSLTFAVERLDGTLTSTFAGSGGCATLDACDIHGTDALTVPAGALEPLEMTAVGPLSALRSRTPKAAIAALLRGDLSLSEGNVSASGRSVWRRTVARVGGTCDDSAAVPNLGVDLVTGRTRVTLALHLQRGFDADAAPVGRCAGPVTSGDDRLPPLAAAAIPLDRLLAGPVTATLTPPGTEARAESGYVVQRAGAIAFGVRLTDATLDVGEGTL